MRSTLNVGIVGLGSRGGRYAEVLAGLRDCELRWVCDVDPDGLEAAERYPRARATDSLDEMLSDESLDAIVVTGPLPARVAQVRAALEADKHVLVEGPLSRVADDAFDLVAAARKRALCLFIGNGALFDPALRKVKELFETGRLGEMLYLHANAQSLGEIQKNADVLWSLGARELGSILYLLEDMPVTVSAWGEAYLRPGFSDVVFCLLRFATGVTAHLHLSWLDPQTVRKVTLVGSRQMAVLDGTLPARRLTLFEHSVPLAPISGGVEKIRIQYGDIVSPVLPDDDPDVLMCQTFLAAVRRGRPLDAEARLATNVASVLEALQGSIEAGGAEQPVAPPTLRFRNVVSLSRR
jgi:predicted dehydrogenase